MKNLIILFLFVNMITLLNCTPVVENAKDKPIAVQQVFERVRAHEFNPLNEENSMTQDRALKVAGIADLQNDDWRVRLLAVRDLVRAGTSKLDEITKGLVDPSIHVRQVCAMSLGILNAGGAISSLEQVIRTDENAMVRSQAIIALGQLEAKQSLDLLREKQKADPSRDVRHQCELSIYQIENQIGVTDQLLAAFLSLDESTFKTVDTGSVAPDFTLEDTEGGKWHLNQFRNKKWVVLIWVFAEWCPVCHGEFHDLMNLREEYNKTNVQVFTLEMHDLYRGRVMVGKELEPDYWFAKESFKDAYTNKIFWPHLLDRAGKYAAMYGADPLAFAVHAEYINRPTTVIIDPKGVVRFSYQGTFWGDRPTIKQTLEMIEKMDFSFEHPQRRKNPELQNDQEGTFR